MRLMRARLRAYPRKHNYTIQKPRAHAHSCWVGAAYTIYVCVFWHRPHLFRPHDQASDHKQPLVRTNSWSGGDPDSGQAVRGRAPSADSTRLSRQSVGNPPGQSRGRALLLSSASCGQTRGPVGTLILGKPAVGAPPPMLPDAATSQETSYPCLNIEGARARTSEKKVLLYNARCFSFVRFSAVQVCLYLRCYDA